MKRQIEFIFFILFLLVSISCKKLPFITDENAIIYIEAIPDCIKTGETCRIFIRGEKGNGYPLPDETIVCLSTSTGEIEREVTLLSGQAEALYKSPKNYSGEVSITARCGQAMISPEQLIVTVTEIDITYLFISADPARLPYEGGRAEIIVMAEDEQMKPVAGKTLWLETNAGSLSGGNYHQTDTQGKIQTTLITDCETTVTVKYKSLTQSVTISMEEQS